MQIQGVSSISRYGYLKFESCTTLELRPHFRVFAEPVWENEKERVVYGISIGWLYWSIALTTEKEQEYDD